VVAAADGGSEVPEAGAAAAGLLHGAGRDRHEGACGVRDRHGRGAGADGDAVQWCVQRYERESVRGVVQLLCGDGECEGGPAEVVAGAGRPV